MKTIKTQEQVKEYALAANDWLYVWGANAEKLTQSLIDRLYQDYGSGSYNMDYYKRKLSQGGMAADCSGFMRLLSGYDDTAQGYYNACKLKNTIGSLPKDLVCLVFKCNSSDRMYHIGIYLGDGTVAEMASSALNYQHKALAGGGWSHWGRPTWIDYADAVNVHSCDLDLEISLPSLVRGHECSYVKTLQQLLVAKGYDTNGVDGIFGAGTERAVAKFQAAARVQVNYPGTVGKKTWEQLLEGF